MGNATIVQIKDKQYLIDCGISHRQIQARMNTKHHPLTRIDGIFLTHEHSDHVNGLVPLVNKYRCPVYLTNGTYRGLHPKVRDNLKKEHLHFLTISQKLFLEDFMVEVIPSYHDALEPCGFRFQEEEKSLVYLTDSGYFPKSQLPAIANADHYIIESNHDPVLLLESDRTWLLKKRILDDQGHLSNEDSAVLITQALGEKTKTITLAHLSQECNTESHAMNTYYQVFDRLGIPLEPYKILCAKQDEPLEWEEL